MVGRGLRTICPMGEDHPGLLQVEVEKHGEMNSSLGGGGSWTWVMRAMTDTSVSISILLLSSPDPPIGCHGKHLLETI
jgi:hypothetical protein